MSDLLNMLGAWVEPMLAGFVTLTGPLLHLRDWIFATFGQNGVYAAYIVASGLVIMMLVAMVRMTVATLKYLVLPSVALAFIGTLLLPVSFTTLLPVTVTACTLVLVFKG